MQMLESDPVDECCGRPRIGEDRTLNLGRNLLFCSWVSVLIGCGATVGSGPQGTEGSGARKPATTSTSKPRTMLPRADQLGPEMDPKVWKIQCSNADLAMMCRKSDPTDRRCAGKRAGKYRWTYGSYCKRALPCSRRACR